MEVPILFEILELFTFKWILEFSVPSIVKTLLPPLFRLLLNKQLLISTLISIGVVQYTESAPTEASPCLFKNEQFSIKKLLGLLLCSFKRKSTLPYPEESRSKRQFLIHMIEPVTFLNETCAPRSKIAQLSLKIQSDNSMVSPSSASPSQQIAPPSKGKLRLFSKIQ